MPFVYQFSWGTFAVEEIMSVADPFMQKLSKLRTFSTRHSARNLTIGSFVQMQPYAVGDSLRSAFAHFKVSQ